MLEDYLSKLSIVKDKKAKVDELMAKADEDLRNQDISGAREIIMERQKMLKKAKGPFNNAIRKIRQGVVIREMKMGALHRKINKQTHERYLREHQNILPD